MKRLIFNTKSVIISYVIEKYFTLSERVGGMKNKGILPKWSFEFKMYCKKHKLTIKDVHNITGIGTTSITNYRTGKKRPSLKTCEKLKEAIGFDMYKALYESYKEGEKHE